MDSQNEYDHNFVRTIAPRPLNLAERELLDFLLSQPFPGRDELRQQVQVADVTEECTCGCPSIVLSVPADAPRASVRRRIPVEAQGVASDGVGIHVLLHVDDDGFVSEAEIFRDDPKPTHLPNLASLSLFFLD